jgi:hypothetical protein
VSTIQVPICCCHRGFNNCKYWQAVNELLHWNFDEISLLKQTNVKAVGQRDREDEDRYTARQQLKLPVKWAQHLLRSGVVDQVFVSYDAMLQYREFAANDLSATNKINLDGLTECLNSQRLLMTTMAAVSGPLHNDVSEKLRSGNTLLGLLTPRFEKCMSRLVAYAAQPTPYIAEIFEAEMAHFSIQALQLFDNYALNSLCKMPAFEAFVQCLARSVIFLSQVLGAAAKARLGGPRGAVESDDLMEGWCGQSLKFLLTTFALLANDPIIVSPPRNPVDAASREDFMTRQLVVQGMESMTAAMFSSLFDAFTCLAICSLLSDISQGGEDEDVDEAAEGLDAAQLQEIVAAICALGRLNAGAALIHLQMNLAKCNEDLSTAVSSVSVNSTQQHQQHLVLLETARMCLLFASNFCAEDFVPCTDLSAQLTGSSPSSEAPSIPALILDSVMTATRSESVLSGLCGVFVGVCSMLRQQLMLLSAKPSTDLLSPLLCQMSLDFIADYLLRYVRPDISNYSSYSQAACDTLAHLHGAWNWTCICFK